MTAFEISALLLAFVAVLALIALALLARMLSRHEASLLASRTQLATYDALVRRDCCAVSLFVRREKNGDGSITAIVRLTLPGLSLHFPVDGDQIESLVAMLRGEDVPDA